MPDFNVRSDSVNVEQIMEQIRARIREKRGVDYTEEEIRQLAAVKLEKFLDPRGVRSDLLDQFRRNQAAVAEAPLPNYAFNEQTLYETHRAPIRWIRRLLNPLLKLFFNPNPLVQALHIQSQINTLTADRDAARRGLVQLQYEVLHNLVIEATRLGIEVKNLKMRVESLSGRLDFNERRARALESVVVYKDLENRQPAAAIRSGLSEPTAARADAAAPPGTSVAPAAAPEGPGQRSRRRRRRRGRRGGGVQPAGGAAPPQVAGVPGGDSEAAHAEDARDETAPAALEAALASESLPAEPLPPPAGPEDPDQ